MKWPWQRKPIYADIPTATPREICTTVRRWVRYVPDDEGRDAWEAPVDTWRRGYGDCEDIAYLIRALCFPAGHRCEVELWYGRGNDAGHAIVRGRGWWASNGEYHEDGSVGHVAAVLGCGAKSVWCRVMGAGEGPREG